MSFRRFPGSETNNSIGLNGQPIPTNSTAIAGNGPTGLLTPILVDSTGKLIINVPSLPLPAGAATSALQITGNSSLSSIDGKTPALGQALAAGSVPVVLTAAQLSTLTPLTVVSSKLQDGSGNLIGSTGGALNVNISSGSLSITNPSIGVDGVTAPLSSTLIGGIDALGKLQGLTVSTNGLKVDGSAVTQPISAASLPLPSLAATSTKQSDGSQKTRITDGSSDVYVASLAANTTYGTPINGLMTGSVLMVQSAVGTDFTVLKANASRALLVDGSAVTQPISGSVSVSNFPATQPISGSVSVSNFPATQPVSGTVTANIGTTNGLALDATVANVQGSSTGGTAASKSDLVGGIYNSASPTLTNGQQSSLQLDSSGNLKISGSITSTNSANGNTNSAVPAQATQIGGSDGTLLRAVSVDTTGKVNINNISGTISLPTLAATSTKQSDGSQKTQIVDGSGNVIGSTLNSLQVIQPDVTASGTITSTQSVSLALNATGTASVQLSGTWTGSVVLEGSTDGVTYYLIPGVALTSGGVASSFSVNNLIQVGVAGFNSFRVRGNTVTSGTVTVSLHGNQATGAIVLSNPIPSGSNTIGSISNISGTVSLPTGAATETTLAALNGKLPATLGQTTMAGSLSVTLASNQSAIKAVATNSVGQFVRNDYTSTSVTTAAYTQLIASTSGAYSALEIFDSSGQTLKLAIGAAGSEVDQFLIFPGGNGRIPFTVASGSRISIKAVSATASAGEIDINFYV